MKFYFAPINRFSNYVYRHVILQEGADYVFSELIMMDRIEKEIGNDKLKIISGDESKTIFQIGVSNIKEIDEAFRVLPKCDEININMGCPHSSFETKCSGLMKNEELMDEICFYFSKECKKRNIIPSVKIRLGLRKEDIRIKNYFKIFEKNNIKKAYVHARTLRHPYELKADYSPLIGLKHDKFELILNGDIDNYSIYEKITNEIQCDGIMIGRAALTNPFIFNEIKNKENFIEGEYDFVVKDPNIITVREKRILSEKKIEFIEKFVALCRKEELREDMMTWNLKHLFKGVSDSKKEIKKILIKKN